MESSFVEVILVVLLATIYPSFCQNTCKTDLRLGNDKTTCYRIFGTNKRWEEAEKHCNSLGGHLVNVNSEQKNWDVLKAVKGRGLVKIWLGVKETAGPWKWITDQAELSDQGCYKDKNGTNDLDVVEEMSDLTAPKCIALCKKKQYRYAGVQNGKDCWCGNQFGKHGFSDDCRKLCRGDNKASCGGKESNRIYYVNGAFSMWNAGQPNNHEGYSTCGSFDRPYGYRWNDVRCTERIPVLCSTDQTAGQCNGAGRMFLANRCFIAVSDPHSWYEGRKKCQREGGDYAVIKDAQTQQVLTTSMRALNLSGVGFWFGLSRAPWVWTSGQPLAFSLWQRGNPNGALQNCAAMSTDDGTWTDVTCENRYSYMCEIDPFATTTTSTTTTTTKPPTTTEEATTQMLTTTPPRPKKKAATFWTKEMLGTVGGVAAGVVFLTLVIIVIVAISRRKSKSQGGDSTSVLDDPEEPKEEPEEEAPDGYFFGLDKDADAKKKTEGDSEENLTDTDGDQTDLEATPKEENGNVVYENTENTQNVAEDKNDYEKLNYENGRDNIEESNSNPVKPTAKTGSVRFEDEEDEDSSDKVANGNTR